MKKEEKESLLRNLYKTEYYLRYHEIELTDAKATKDKAKIRHYAELYEFARGLAQQALYCLTDIYRDTKRLGTLDAKEMSDAIVAIQKIAREDAEKEPPKPRKPTDVNHFIRELDVDDDEEEAK